MGKIESKRYTLYASVAGVFGLLTCRVPFMKGCVCATDLCACKFFAPLEITENLLPKKISHS